MPFQDGAHILYVNGEFQDVEHPIGRLMYDFHCTNADQMFNPILAEEVRYLKETKGGQNYMCRAMEEMREEAADNKAIRMAIKMLERGRDTLEEIAEITELSLEEVKELAKKQTA